VNGDGVLDVITAHTDEVDVLLGLGNGSFAAPMRYPLAPGVMVPNWNDSLVDVLAIGDLDGDGSPDLAATRNTGTVTFLRNLGDGTFQPYSFGVAVFPRGLAVGDLNRDGLRDVLVLASEGVLPMLGQCGR
jgi:hypothetical protein